MIILNTKIDAAAGFPALTDYQAALANDVRCAGIWSFDADSVTQGVGGIASVTNWKTGGTPLIQAASARRPGSAYDDDLRRPVAVFSSSAGQFLTATDPGTGVDMVWNADLEWTIVALVKPTVGAGANDFHMIAGEFAGANFVGLCTVNDRYSYQTRTGINAAGASIQSRGREGWNRVVGVNRGLYIPQIQLNEGSILAGPAAGSGNQPTSTTFRVGNQFLPFGGSIDLIGLFKTDLSSDANADLRATLNSYLDERTGLFC